MARAQVTQQAGIPAPSSIQIWMMAARPKTLPAGIAPVLVGTALAGFLHVFHPLRFVAALLGSILIQIGANLSNDYSDAHRGADTEDRLGPVRVTAGGLVPPRQVLIATYVTFGLAVLCGVYLIAVAGWQLLLIGVASIAAGVLYTGGPRPYGYLGLGEVFVFVFFGLVATAGSAYVQHGRLGALAVAASVPVGLLSVSLLESNNLRDVAGDAAAGKRTLAVRVGVSAARWLYVGAVLASFATVGLVAWWRPFALLALAALVLAWRPCRVVVKGAQGRDLLPVLAATGRLQLVVGILLTLGIAL